MIEIYDHATVGTKVVFRYDLEVTEEAGVGTCLEDIYGLSEKSCFAELRRAFSQSFTEIIRSDFSVQLRVSSVELCGTA